MKNTLVVLFNLFFGLIVFSQNGKIISKSLIDLSKTPIWNTISKNDSLTQEYNYLKNLNFYFITYQSDKLVIDGILSEPKSIGKYPVIIYNRGGNRNFGKCQFVLIPNLQSRCRDLFFLNQLSTQNCSIDF